MVILRPTRKLKSFLPASEGGRSSSETALGDWYVNRIIVDRQPLLLLVSSASLLPLLVPARDVRGLPDRLADLVVNRLRHLGIEASAINAERNAMKTVEISSTIDRSVLGIMVDFAKTVPLYLERGSWNENTLQLVEERLSQTPCHAGRAFESVVFPKKKAAELLRVKWLASTPLPPIAEKRG